MFKINNKSYTHQRAVWKHSKNNAIHEEEVEEDDDILEEDDVDDASSGYSSGIAITERDETMLLAQFLSTTGPEEYKKPEVRKQFKRASRLLSRLRKRPTMAVLRPDQQQIEGVKKNYIPLPVYEPITAPQQNKSSNAPSHHHNKPIHAPNTKAITSTNMKQQQHQTVSRDSGIYSESSDRDSSVVSNNSMIPVPPLPQLLQDLQQFPRPPYSSIPTCRPAPLPPVLANAVRQVPEAALKRRSVRLRHVQVQTETETLQQTDRQSCPHCRQVIGKSDNRVRRPSCPPSLSSGPMQDKTDAKELLAMILKLKSQLAEEKQCRLKLEKAMYEKKNLVVQEKSRWAGDCLWLDDRIAYLPE